MSAFYFDNAMAWAQFRLKGGWKNILTVIPVVFALLGAICIIVYESNPRPRDRADMMLGMTTLLLALQCIVLLGVATMRLRSAIGGDLASRRIESHRLMPLSTHQAVVGYMSGGLLQLIFMALAIFIVGCGTSIAASLQIQTWLSANLLLFTFAVMLWCVTIMMAFVMRFFFWIFVILFFITLMSQGVLLLFVPGLLMLCAPMFGDTIFHLQTYSPDFAFVAGVAIIGQFIFSILCVIAASRKYARDDAQAWPLFLSLAMLVVWVALCCFGIIHIKDIAPLNSLREIHALYDINPVVIGSIVSSIAVASMTMSAAAWSFIMARRHRQENPDSKGSTRIPFPLVLVLAVGVVMCLTLIKTPENGVWAVAVTCAIALTQIYLLMRSFYGRFQRANMMIAGLMALQWLVPLIFDLVYYAVTEPNASPRLDFLAPISPLVMLMGAYGETNFNPVMSLISQLIILFLASLLFLRLSSEPKPQTAPAAAPAPSPFPLPTSPAPVETPADPA